MWYGEEGGEEFSIKFHLGGEDMVVADFFVDALNVLLFEETAGDRVARTSAFPDGVWERGKGISVKAELISWFPMITQTGVGR